jgi:hypothetical protein
MLSVEKETPVGGAVRLLDQRQGGSKGMSATKLFCLKKDNLFVSWDGKSMTGRPSQAGRFSKTICQRKYPGYERITFPEAYNQWHEEQRAKREEGK